MTWTYHAMRATTREWLHREVPVSDVKLSPALSGPYGLTATIEPEYADLIADDGELLLSEWGTLIFAEASGQLRGGGIVTDTKIVGQRLDLTIDGFTAYPTDIPIVTTLTWGGPSAGATGAGVDPFDVVRAMWDHVQSFAQGNLGVTYTQNSTPYRLGAWHNARRRDEDGELDEDPKAIQDPPIDIDKVWTKSDKKPQAAQGKTVYWKYQLPWWDAVEVGQKINELARQVPFDYRERYAWADSSKEDVVMELQLGYPRLGRRQSNLTFVEGENVTDLVPISRDGGDYFNTVYGFGSGEGSKQLRQVMSHRDGERLRRVKIEDRPEVSNKAALKAIAKEELLRTLHLADITQFTVVDHPNARIGSFDVGDDVLVENRRGWQPTKLWVRITGFDYQPETGQITVKCSRSDRFRYGGV